MSQEISVLLNLQTMQAIEKLDGFLHHAVSGLKELVSEVAAVYLTFEGLHKLEEVVSEALNLEEAVGRLSEKTGLSIPLVAALKSEANAVKVTFDQLTTSLGKYSANVYIAATDGGKAGSAFEHMGIEVKDTTGHLRNIDIVLEETAEWFKTHANGAEKAATAMALFGRSGRELIPVLNQGAEGIRKMKQEGGPITDSSVANATEFETKLREMHEALELFWTGIANDLLPTLIKLEDIFSALPRIMAQAWKDRKLPELIGLMIEVGFELGLAAGKALFSKVWDSITSESAGQLYMTLINAVITFGSKAATFLIDALKDPIIAMAGGFDWLYDQLRVGFSKVGQWLQEIFAGVLNFFIESWNKIAPKIHAGLIESLNWGKDEIDPAKSLDQSMEDMLAFAGPGFEQAKQYLNEQLEQTRIILGVNQKINDSDNLRLTALERLNALIEQYKTKYEHIKLPTDSDTTATSKSELKQFSEVSSMMNELFKQQQLLIQSNPFTSQLEKGRELLPILEQQRELLLKQYEIGYNQLQRANTEDEKIAAKKELIKLQGQLNALDIEETKINANSSISGQTKIQWAQLLSQTENFAAQMGKVLLSPIEGFRKGFNTAFNELLLTGRLNFSQLAGSILTTMRQAFVNMVTDWIVSHVIMKGISLAFHAILNALGWAHVAEKKAQDTTSAAAGEALAIANLAALVPIAAAASLMWATPATLATISSYGGAAAAAPAEISAATAIVSATAAIPREAGGPVFAGRTYLVGEKRPELFVPHADGMILPNVPSPSSSLAQSFGAGSKGSGPTGSNVTVYTFTDPRLMADHIEKNSAHEKWVVDTMRKNIHRVT